MTKKRYSTGGSCQVQYSFVVDGGEATRVWAGLDMDADRTGQSIRILFWGAVDFLNMTWIQLVCVYITVFQAKIWHWHHIQKASPPIVLYKYQHSNDSNCRQKDNVCPARRPRCIQTLLPGVCFGFIYNCLSIRNQSVFHTSDLILHE